jgi:autotransporter-associated beta strand protein
MEDGGVIRFSEGAASNTVTNNITVSSNSSGVIEHGTGTGTLTLAGILEKNAATLTLRGTNTGVITITGGIRGAEENSDLVYDSGKFNVNSSNSYNGPTYLINGAVVNANAAFALPTANGRSALYLDQTNTGAASGSGSSILNLGINQSIASIAGGISSSLNLGSSTLTIGTVAGNTTFAGNISGTGGGALIKDGASTMTLSGNNSYTGGTFLTAGNITVASTNALGVGSVSLQEGRLNLLTNLSIASLDWRTNAILSLTPGLQELNINGLFTNSIGSTDGFTFDFGGISASGTNTVIRFGSIWSGFTTNSFSVLGNANWGFALNTDRLVAFYLAAGDITNSVNTTIAASQTNASLTVNGGVTTINEGVTNTSTNSVTITSGSGTNVGTLNNMGGIVTPVLMVSAGVLSNASSGTIIASNSMTLNNGAVYNSGTITAPNFTQNGGVMQLASGGVLDASSNVTINAGSLTNNGTIRTTDFIQNGGSVLNNSSLIASNSFSLNNGTFANYGTLTTPNFYVSQSASFIGQVAGANVTLNGQWVLPSGPKQTVQSVILNPTADLIFEVSSNASNPQPVHGSVQLGGTIEILPADGFALQYGDKFDIFVSGGPIKGEYDKIIMPPGFRGRSVTVGDPTNSIYAAPVSYTQLAATQNQLNVARALDTFIPATSGDKLVVSTALDKLTASQYPQAFEAIQPTLYQSLSTIAFNLANAQNMELNQRLWSQRLSEGGGFSMSGFAANTPFLEGQGDGKSVLDAKDDILRPGPDNRWGLFVDGNGIFAQANSGNMLPNYNAQSGGVTTGVTFRVNPTITIGAYTGYEGTYAKYNGGSSIIDNSVRFGVFGTYGKTDGRGFYVNAILGGGYNQYQVTRNIQFPGINRTANSQPAAGELDTMLAGGYNFRKGNWTFGPTTSLQYTYLGVNGFNETGAQSLNLSSGGWNTASLLGSLGAQVAYTWQATKDLVVIPQMNLSWQHEFLQNSYTINSTMGGANFANLSNAPLRDYLYTGIGVTFEFKQKWFTSIFYNAAAGNSNLQSQNIFWSFGCRF